MNVLQNLYAVRSFLANQPNKAVLQLLDEVIAELKSQELSALVKEKLDLSKKK